MAGITEKGNGHVKISLKKDNGNKYIYDGPCQLNNLLT